MSGTYKGQFVGKQYDVMPRIDVSVPDVNRLVGLAVYVNVIQRIEDLLGVLPELGVAKCDCPALLLC
jgi:hypothetical protein